MSRQIHTHQTIADVPQVSPQKVVEDFLKSGVGLEGFDRFYSMKVTDKENTIRKLRKHINQIPGIAVSNPFLTLTYEFVGLGTHLSPVQTCSDFSSVVWGETYNQR